MTVPVLSICTGMGLMDRAFIDTGFDVLPGCEIDPDQRELHHALIGSKHLTHDLRDLPALLAGQRFQGLIGGPSCQAHTKLRAVRAPKFPDLTPLVLDLLKAVVCDWFVFENVVPIAIPGAVHTRLNAMHFYRPHQSRVRWFTHSSNVSPPPCDLPWQRRRPHGLQRGGGTHLWAETRSEAARVSRGCRPPVSLCPVAEGLGQRGAVPAGPCLGGIDRLLDSGGLT